MKVSRGELAIGVLTLPLAFALWYLTFAVDAGNFWVKISLSAALLAAVSLTVMGPARAPLLSVRPRHLKLGVASAILLYALFWLGKWVLTAVLPGSHGEISAVYRVRAELPPPLIAALLFFVTGPSEELYWRGLVQRILVQRVGPASGLFLAAGSYALAHIWTLNLSLMLAAFAAGAIWGWIYLTERSLVPVIVSHSLWSVAIFVLFPLG